MRETYFCKCGAKSTFETDTTPPSFVKCFKCHEKIQRKAAPVEEDATPVVTSDTE
jgi:hypothetical protein